MTVSLGDDIGIVSLAGVNWGQIRDVNDPESGEPRTNRDFSRETSCSCMSPD